MYLDFRWNEWNLLHIAKHAVTVPEAEAVVRGARRPYPRQTSNEKVLVRGRTAAGRYLQVIYVVDPDETLYIIHARPLSDTEKRRLRRSIK